MPRYVASKWRKTVAFRKSAPLAKYVPATLKMTRASLFNQLNQYRMVYIKPDFGSYGNGVMRVEHGDGYRYQIGKKIRKFGQFSTMYESILRQTGGKRYLVQKGIHLLEYKGGRFDLRVMVQCASTQSWETKALSEESPQKTKS